MPAKTQTQATGKQNITEAQKTQLVDAYVQFQVARQKVMSDYTQNLNQIEKEFIKEAERITKEKEQKEMETLENAEV